MLVWRIWTRALTSDEGIRVNYHIDGTGVQRTTLKIKNKTRQAIEYVNELTTFNRLTSKTVKSNLN